MPIVLNPLKRGRSAGKWLIYASLANLSINKYPTPPILCCLVAISVEQEEQQSTRNVATVNATRPLSLVLWQCQLQKPLKWQAHRFGSIQSIHNTHSTHSTQSIRIQFQISNGLSRLLLVSDSDMQNGSRNWKTLETDRAFAISSVNNAGAERGQQQYEGCGNGNSNGSQTSCQSRSSIGYPRAVN